MTKSTVSLHLVVCAALPLVLACEGRSSTAADPSGAVAPSVLASSSTRSLSSVGRTTAVRVDMQDACDPDTFNAVLGPGGCTRTGGMTFDQFSATLTKLGFVGPWHFAPNTANVQADTAFLALNQGGETHTFTEVAQFGGGIVPSLNDAAGVPTIAPECAALEPDDFVRPGGTYTETVNTTGTVRFQCCIHPWMRLEAQVSSR
ncbi:MAG TPA: hypothetical protein VL173_04560 [Vicinamibacterales bacterium]|jgi:hypothetical protein|nr:hypothetical protein [Vicinamibacterales bacterium]